MNQCRAVLAKYEAYFVSSSPGVAELFDSEGDLLIVVPHDIQPDALEALFKFGASQYESGRRVGEQMAHLAMQKAMGIKN